MILYYLFLINQIKLPQLVRYKIHKLLILKSHYQKNSIIQFIYGTNITVARILKPFWNDFTWLYYIDFGWCNQGKWIREENIELLQKNGGNWIL